MKQLIEKIIALLTKRTDFTLHYLFIYLIASVTHNVGMGFMNKWWAFLVANVVAILFGIGKEHIDKHIRGQFIEKGDLISDGAGLLTYDFFFIVGFIISVL